MFKNHLTPEQQEQLDQKRKQKATVRREAEECFWLHLAYIYINSKRPNHPIGSLVYDATLFDVYIPEAILRMTGLNHKQAADAWAKQYGHLKVAEYEDHFCGLAIPVHEIDAVLKELWEEGMAGEFDDSQCNYPVNEVLQRAAKRLGRTIDFE